MMTTATRAMFSPDSPIAGSRAGPGRDSGWRAAPDEGRTSKARALIRLALIALCLLILTGTAFARNPGVDITAADPVSDLSIEIASHWGGPIRGGDVQGNYAYIANGRMFRILDISDETNPVEVGALKLSAGISANYPGEVYDVKVRGDYAFVGGDGQYFFNVVDVSDPTAPGLVRSFGDSTYRIAAQIELYEDSAYVFEKSGFGLRIRIYRIDDPINAFAVGQLGGTSTFTSITMGNGHLFVGLFYGGGGELVRIYDLANPSIPVLVGALVVPGLVEARSLVVAGDHLYTFAQYDPSQVSGRDYRLLTANISDPAAPVLTDTHTGFASVDQDRQLAVSDGRLYVIDQQVEPSGWSTYKGLYIFDIAQSPEAPALLDTYRPSHGVYHTVVSAAPGRVYLWDKAEGLVIMDVADPSLPRPLGKYHSPGALRKAVVDGSHLYVSDEFGGFTVLDVADTSRPRVVGRYLAKRHDVVAINASGIDKVDDIVYLAAGSSGLLTVDVSDPARPHTLGAMRISSMAFPSSPWCGAEFQALKVRDQVAYLTYLAHFCFALAKYLLAVDVSDPFSPVAVGVAWSSTSRFTRSLALGDGIVATGGQTSTHADNPADPQLLHGPMFHQTIRDAEVALHESFRLIVVREQHSSLLPPGMTYGLNIQDISDPTEPVTVSTLAVGESMLAQAVQSDRSRVWLRTDQSLLAVEISDPAAPVEIHRLPDFRTIHGSGLAGGSVGLLADEPNLYATDALGLTVLNVHDAVPDGAGSR